jgi:hypothetical protein
MSLSHSARLMRSVLTITALEGVVVWALLLGVGIGEGGSGRLFTGPRGLLVGGLTLGLTVAVAWATGKAYGDPQWLERTAEWIRRLASGEDRLRFAVAVFYGSVLLLLAALFGVSLRMNPDPRSLLAVFFGRGLPALLWLSLIALQGALMLHAIVGRSTIHMARTFTAGGILTGLIVAYWYGAEGQLLQVNVDMGLTDQSAYMDYARQLRDSGYAYPGDFNRMPVYPFLVSLVLRPGMMDPEFFLSAKYLNLFLSVLLLAGLAVIFIRRFDLLAASNLILIVAFTLYIYKAGWVQAELLFYFLNTCLFILLWHLLQQPDYRTAVAAGLVAGLAHLTKASLWPGLVLFSLFAVLRGAAQLLGRARGKEPGVSEPGWRKSLLVVPLAGLVFLLVIGPYIRVSRQITGRYFYNVNSTFYVWYDSWEEAESGTKAHGDRVGWPDMPASEIPTFGKYLREHTAALILERVTRGGEEIMTRVLRSYGYFDYLLVYGGLLLVAAGLRWRRTRKLISENLLLLLFFVAYFSVYVVLYFWYAPITAGDRLILALFIPLLLVLSTGLRGLLGRDRIQIQGRSVAWWTIVNLVILGLAAADTVWALERGVYVLRGGG